MHTSSIHRPNTYTRRTSYDTSGYKLLADSTHLVAGMRAWGSLQQVEGGPGVVVDIRSHLEPSLLVVAGNTCTVGPLWQLHALQAKEWHHIYHMHVCALVAYLRIVFGHLVSGFRNSRNGAHQKHVYARARAEAPRASHARL